MVNDLKFEHTTHLHATSDCSIVAIGCGFMNIVKQVLFLTTSNNGQPPQRQAVWQPANDC
jgi:hypothetical protein